MVHCPINLPGCPFFHGDIQGERSPPKRDITTPTLAVAAIVGTFFIYNVSVVRPPLRTATPATIAATQRVITTLRAETNRVLARRRLRNADGDEIVNELCQEALKAAIDEIIDRTIKKVIEEAQMMTSDESLDRFRDQSTPDCEGTDGRRD